jgi:hypothetical protein
MRKVAASVIRATASIALIGREPHWEIGDVGGGIGDIAGASACAASGATIRFCFNRKNDGCSASAGVKDAASPYHHPISLSP